MMLLPPIRRVCRVSRMIASWVAGPMSCGLSCQQTDRLVLVPGLTEIVHGNDCDRSCSCVSGPFEIAAMSVPQ